MDDLAYLDRGLIAFVMVLEGGLATRPDLPRLFRIYLILAFVLSFSWIVAPIPPDGAKWGIPLTAWIVGISQFLIGSEGAWRLTRGLPGTSGVSQFTASLSVGLSACWALKSSQPMPYAGFPTDAYYARLFGACCGFVTTLAAWLFCQFERDECDKRDQRHAVILAIYLGSIFLADRSQWAIHKLTVNTLLMPVHAACMIAWVILWREHVPRVRASSLLLRVESPEA